MLYEIPKIDLDVELEENLGNIEKIIDDLNRRRDKGLSSEFQEKLNQQLLISHVYHSNAIEGNKLTIRETELILNGIVVNERPLKDELEAQSLANATEYLYSIIKGTEQLNERTLLELHGLILGKIDNESAGIYRNTEVQIKNSDHVPPSFLHINDNIEKMFQWMNRYSHKYPPVIMASVLHHWITWIHPFKDGNGRISRLFLNFYLIQKGYPEIVIKIQDRDNYYNSLISADKGEINPLIELIADKLRQSVDVIEEFINEDERQKEWKQKYSEKFSTVYEKAREHHSFQYEVWKNQINIFKTLFADAIKDLHESISFIEFSLQDYEPITFNQYIDLLEGKKVTNTWCLKFRVFNKISRTGISFVFFARRFAIQKSFKLLGEEVLDKDTGKAKIREENPQVKLYISPRIDGKSEFLDDRVDLINVGSWADQLVFGIHNREWHASRYYRRAKIITKKGNPRKVIRKFIDQVLKYYFEVDAY